jgi:amino acid transporter
MQVNIMMVQGVIVSLLAVFFALSPSVQSVFWIFSAMAVQLYLIMYMVMFMAAMRLRRTRPDVVRGFRAPAMMVIGWMGFFASLAAFLIGFVQPTGSSGVSQLAYTLALVGGIVILGVWPFILYRFRRSAWKTTPDAGAADTTHAPAPQA